MWNSALQPVLTPGTATTGTCQGVLSGPSANPAFAAMVINPPDLAVPTAEPTFTASTSETGLGLHMEVELSNGKTLIGYPGLALTGQSGPDAADMAWAVGDSTTYTDYQTAYDTAGAPSATVEAAWIDALAGTAPGASAPAPPVTLAIIDASSDNTGLQLTATGLPDGLTVGRVTSTPNGGVSGIDGTPVADAKSGTATITVTDAYGQVATATIAYTVNQPPAPVPVLSHGQAVATSPTRETVTWQQTVPSWEKFIIVGPGAINGHVGWVPPGTESGYYAGLEAHHGYTVTYTPYTAKNGTPITGAVPGKVYFVT